MNKKKLGDLNLMDDFLFQAIMSYPDIGELFAQKILELIFHRQFRNLEIVAQKVYGHSRKEFGFITQSLTVMF